MPYIEKGNNANWKLLLRPQVWSTMDAHFGYILVE